MREVDQAPDDSQRDVFADVLASETATVVNESEKEPQEEREIVLPPELIAQIGHPNEPAPRFLRLRRALVGLVLLAVVWGCVVLVLLLASVVLNDLDDPVHVSLHFLLYLVGILVMAWLIVVALASLVAGAFSLSLALSRRDW